MKKYRIVFVVIILLVVAVSAIVLLINQRTPSERATNWHIVGDNPNGTSIDELPVCNFTGAGYEVTPCYEKNGTINL